jgi:hypothetical protein
MDYDGREPLTLIELFGGQGTINVNSWSPIAENLLLFHI